MRCHPLTFTPSALPFRLLALIPKRLCRPLAAALLFLPAAVPAPAAEWLLTGALGAHDPSIIKENDTYPNGNWWWSPATGGGLAMKFSTDGVKWIQGLQLFTPESKPEWWTEYAPGMRPLNIWSPDLHKFGDRFWCYYAISEFGKNNSAIGLVSSSGIFRGDWRDEGVVLSSRQGRDDFNAIDPNLVVDADGHPWLAFGSYHSGLHVVQLDPATMKPAPGAPLVNIARRRSDLGLDGPNIVYREGYYYLFTSVDLCCNGKVSTLKIAVARSKQIVGPYEGKPSDTANAVSDMLVGSLTVFERGDTRWAGMGGPSVVRLSDGWIIIRHGYDKNAGGAQKMRISDLYWDADGWPTFTAPAITDKTAASGETVTFDAPSSITYRWQISSDQGGTWTNVSDGDAYTGATSIKLNVKASPELNGHKFRVITGNGGGTSNAATLTVTSK